MTLRELLQLPQTQNDKPVVAVPLMLGPTDKLTPFAQQLQAQKPDVVEWRADYIADDFSEAVMWQQVKAGAQAALAQKAVSAMTEAKMLAEIDQAQQEFKANWPIMNQQIIKELTGSVFDTIGGFPIILTYRTQAQGGRGEMSPLEYTLFMVNALQAGYHFAAVDVEYTLPAEFREKIMAAARAVGVPVIMSYHDLNETPDVPVYLADLAATGADIVKLAVTPHDEADVERLLLATQAQAAQMTQPLITISMGLLGERSRIEGYKYGSEMTFAVLDGQPVSAPGQLTLTALRAAWQAK
ncbi:type I 3-dehydroquinate dehydratase [Leuconostoc lactis]